MKKFYTIFLMVIWAFSLNAQWSQITGVNISGVADYDNLVYTGSSVLLINEAGVYRSTNNGISWQLSVAGLDTTNLSVDEIVYISTRNEVWLISNGNVFKSVNDGVTWIKQDIMSLIGGNGWFNRIGRIGNRLIVAYSDYDSGAGTQVTNLYYSDNGSTWKKGAKVYEGYKGWFEFIHSFNNRMLGIVFDPNDGNDRKFYFSYDGTDIGDFPLTGVGTEYELEQNYFSIDPSGGNLFFINKVTKKIFRFNFSSNVWEEKMNGIDGGGMTLGEIFSIHSLGSHAFASALFFSKYPPQNPEEDLSLKFFYSSDNGDHWTLVSNPGVSFPIFENEMIFAGSGRLIGSYMSGHLAFSDNLGQEWKDINDIHSGEFKYLVSLADGSIFARSGDQLAGLIKSTNNGNTWIVKNGNLPNLLGIYFIGEIWYDGINNIMYLTSQLNPFEEKYELFKSTDGGENWVQITTAPDSKLKQLVGKHGPSKPIIYFGDRDGNGTYQFTSDGGATWTDITPGINALGIKRVMGIKGNGTLMLLFAEDNSQIIRVFKSTNHGASFTDISGELIQPGFQIMVADRWEWERQPSAVAGFSYDGTKFMVAVMNWNVWPNQINFYELNATQDGWVKKGTDGIKVPYNIDCYALRHQGNGNVWYFVTPCGVYASVDNCETWLRVWNNQGYVMGMRPKSFLINDYGVFVGTDNGGLWRAQLTPPVVSTMPATEITETSAKTGGIIVSTGGLPFLGKALVYDTNPDPTIPPDVTIGFDNSWSDFSTTILSLTPNTTYYVKAVVTSPKGKIYGNEISFTTLNPTGVVVHKPGEVYLYPNPSNGLFNIVADADMTMTVLNVIGKTVLTAPVYNGINTYELKNQPAGIYFVKLNGEGRQEQTIRLIIK